MRPAIGRKLTLNGQAVEIVGVTPADFSGVEIGRAYDVAVPICSQAVLWSDGNWLNEGTTWWLTVMGRLKAGWTLAKTNAQLRASSTGLFESTLPANYPAVNVKDYLKFKLEAVPAQDRRIGVARSVQRSADSAACHRRAGAADRVFQSCQSHAGARHRPRARNRGAPGHWGVARPPGAATHGRERFAGFGGWRGRAAACRRVSHLMVALLGTPGNSLFLDLEPGGGVFAFAAATRGSHLLSIRADPGPAGYAQRPRRCHENRRPQPYEQP